MTTKAFLKTLWRRVRLLDVINTVVAVVMLSIAIATYRVARDTSELKQAVSNISALADQTKRQADETHNQVGELQGQTLIFKDELAAMQRQADAAQGQVQEMHAEQRPQISIEGIASTQPLTFDDHGALLWVEFRLKNVGRSVAAAVDVVGTFYARTDTAVAERQKKACAMPDKNPAGNEPQGFNIVQGEDIPERHWWRMSPGEVSIWKKTGATPMIVGCIDYVFDQRHHQTPFVFEVDRPSNLPNQFTKIDPNDGDVPANQIVFAIPPWFVSQPN